MPSASVLKVSTHGEDKARTTDKDRNAAIAAVRRSVLAGGTRRAIEMKRAIMATLGEAPRMAYALVTLSASPVDRVQVRLVLPE